MAKPTLLVVDVQNAWDDPALGQRNNDPSAEENVARLLQAWRRAEAPIIHVRQRETDPDWPMLHEGNPGFEFMDEALPKEGEPVLTKEVNSAFIGTDLEERLRRMRAKVGLQSRVLDLVEEDVKFASDHAVRLPAWSALADRAS
jgi:nicotinamidase-related amidase